MAGCLESGASERDDLRPDGRYRVGEERKQRISKRGRVGEGRPTKGTPEVVAKIAEAVAIGLKAHGRKKVNPPVWDIL